MESNYSLGDIVALLKDNDGLWNGGNGMIFLLFILILLGGGGIGWGNRQGDFGQFATAASQNEILLGQKFSDLDNKIDRGFTSIGNGISDATFALNNVIKDGNSAVAGTVITEGRGISDKLCEIKTAIHAEGESTRALIQQNKIETLQAQVNELKTQNMFCGVPRINPYAYNIQANCGCNCGCGNAM